MCFPCRKSYRQLQGLRRHIREAHNPSACHFCEFKWGRRYEYRDHLRKKHPGVHPDMILGKAPRPRRRATTEPQRPVSPPGVEKNQQNGSGSQPKPSAPPFPAGGVTIISPPSVSPVADSNSHPVYAEQIVSLGEREYTHGSFLGLEQIFST